MCRSIKTLFNFEPPATDAEVRAASLQFVRKLSGFSAPSQANQAVFDEAVEDIYKIARHLVDAMITNAPPKDREEEAAKAKERNLIRFGGPKGPSSPMSSRPQAKPVASRKSSSRRRSA